MDKESCATQALSLQTSVPDRIEQKNKPRDAILIQKLKPAEQCCKKTHDKHHDNMTNNPVRFDTRSEHETQRVNLVSPKLPPQKGKSKNERQNTKGRHPEKHESRSRPSSNVLAFAKKKEKEDVQKFLCNQLVTVVSEIEGIKCTDSESTTSVSVCFSRVSAAKVALELLHGNKEYTVRLAAETNSSLTVSEGLLADIECLRSKCETKREDLMQQLDLNIQGLKSKLNQKQRKYVSLEEHERRIKEREVLNLKITEYEQQVREFDQYICTQLSLLSSASARSEVSIIEMKLEREYTRFSGALPIYAKRSEILETVCSNHVTVLVGETGSGKSTQVVQYLYEAGMAKEGIIACTQPRKVAAITLAKYVSMEMQIKLGEEIGYRVGMNEKCSKKTKLFYMTDHVLLNEYIADRTLSMYSCILIDEAHERSINSDMLLSFLKQCLPSHPNLKVVIMSATIEPELFVKYFQSAFTPEQVEDTRVSTIMVSGRTFPVEVEYDSVTLSPDNNYVMNAVDSAKRIHKENRHIPGDILVFLTCAPEIERACRAMECLHDETVVLPLHGKLPPDEQQKVFDDYGNKRKIIFSTNVAETSITIPGVKYVIDTGLAKEMHFDSTKNMDSLEVCMISKSSAEQRMGRAGRVSAGKCYRLYTMDDYASKMPARTKPEILRIQLSQVVLKLLEFGVANVLTFDFVEHPDRVALEAAVEILRFVGAIRGNTLTDFGRKMVTLPIMPQLAKVLLDAINMGLGAEALISVAISSLAGQVFFRGGTDEMKAESDKMKLAFCHQMGDQMTSLSVYQCWQQQKNEERTKWCLEKFVNAKSMRIVEETAKELRHVLKKQLKVDLKLKLGSLEAADCYLGKLYFDAFLTNLAVYLGHDQAGYITLNETSGSFVIFPGSSLKQLNSTPKYVIYEKTLKTSRQFLTQVMCVKQEWVDEAVRVGKLSEDPAVRFRNLMFTPFHVVATGPQIYRDIVMKQKELLETVRVNSPQGAISPVIDCSTSPKQWGIVRAVAQMKCHDTVQLIFTQEVREKQAEYQDETNEFRVTKEHSIPRVVIGAGGTVQQIIMPFQIRTVIAVGSDECMSLEQVKCQLKKYGEVKTVKYLTKQSKGFRLSVTYSTSAAAQRALAEGHLIPNVTLQPQNSQQFTLKLQWERRQRGPFAFLSFDSNFHCDEAYQEIQFGTLYYRKIRVSLDKFNPSKLFLTGDILCTCDETDLKLRIQQIISTNFFLKMGYKKFYKKETVHDFVYERESDSDTDNNAQDSSSEPEAQESETYRECIEEKLTDLIAKYTELRSYSVKYVIPHESAVFFRAYVAFDDPDEGYKVLYSDLNEEKIDGKLLTVTPSLKCTLVYRREIYPFIQYALEKVRNQLLQCYMKVLYIKIFQPGKSDKDMAHVSITADDVKAFSVAQKMFHQAAEPLVVHCNTTELREYILSQSCQKEIQIIQSNTSTYIWRDLKAMGISIYGSKRNQQTAMDLVKMKAEELFSGGASVTELNLSGDGKPPGLMKHLVTRYGYDLHGMLELEGVRRISLKPHLQLMSLLATTKGQDSVSACIKELITQSAASGGRRDSEYEFVCSACFTLIEEPTDLFRLECCGHAFHTECIAMQMKADTLVLPVQCAKEGCSKDFALKDFENLQKRSKFRVADLVSVAIQNCMEKNGEKYRNCPTPDCKMIYGATEKGGVFMCGNCSVSICTKCHVQYHAGISCEIYRNTQKSDEEFNKWMKEDPDNRKRCPKCSSPIEKNEGCMHMHCRCGSHICWRCMKYFKTEHECYNHQAYCLVRAPITNPVRRTPTAAVIHTPPATAVNNPPRDVTNTPLNNPYRAMNNPPRIAQPRVNNHPPVHTPPATAVNNLPRDVNNAPLNNPHRAMNNPPRNAQPRVNNYPPANQGARQSNERSCIIL